MLTEWLRTRFPIKNLCGSQLPTLCDQSLPIQTEGSEGAKETATSSKSGNNNSANFDVYKFFNDLLRRPREPTRDEKFAAAVLPVTSTTGGKPFREDRDGKSNQAYPLPWAASRAPYGAHLHADAAEGTVRQTEDTDRKSIGEKRSAESVSHRSPLEGLSIPQLGYRAAPQFDSDWEPILAHQYGLFAPESFEPALSLSEIRREVADFDAKLRLDNSDEEACHYLALEEFKCLRQNHFKLDPQLASRRCVKWYNEWRQCRWDQEKVRRGIYYIDPRPEKKHRPFYSAPNFIYA